MDYGVQSPQKVFTFQHLKLIVQLKLNHLFLKIERAAFYFNAPINVNPVGGGGGVRARGGDLTNFKIF